jgi:hypothetical protein
MRSPDISYKVGLNKNFGWERCPLAGLASRVNLTV